MASLLTILLALTLVAEPQLLHLEQLDRLAAKADETVNLTLDGSLLRAAAGFLDVEDDSDAAELKKLISKLNGISVRSFSFKREGEYTAADVEAIQSQLREARWKRVIQTHSKSDGDVDVYVSLGGPSGAPSGVAILAREPKELTVVSIDGSISIESLRKLGGNFGIPRGLGKEDKK